MGRDECDSCSFARTQSSLRLCGSNTMSDGGQVDMPVGRDSVEPTNIVGEAALLANSLGIGFPGTTASSPTEAPCRCRRYPLRRRMPLKDQARSGIIAQSAIGSPRDESVSLRRPDIPQTKSLGRFKLVC